ncbi:MAG: glycosyltransferase family 2 protein [Hyphomicrobiaceae bacterium]|nr:glycosyltransferase family 2 protein [Hyphomicrobiaceae bacterium]
MSDIIDGTEGKILLSIVIPVYNVLPYLGELLASLSGFDRPDVELLFVGDCDQDGSIEHIRQSRSRFANCLVTIVENEQNRGLSRSRRVGLEACRGEYVWFLDSDDIVISDHATTLLEIMDRTKCDFIAFDFFYFAEPPRRQLEHHVSRRPFRVPHAAQPGGIQYVSWIPQTRLLPAGKVMKDRSEYITGYFADEMMYAWLFAAKRDLLLGIDFPDRMSFEDIATVPAMLMRTSAMYYLPLRLVGYRQRAGSIMSTRSPQKGLDILSAMDRHIAEFEALRPELSRQAQAHFLAFFLRVILWAEQMINAGGGFRYNVPPELIEVHKRFKDLTRGFEKEVLWLAIKAFRTRHDRRFENIPDLSELLATGRTKVAARSPNLYRFLFGMHRPRRSKILQWVSIFM